MNKSVEAFGSLYDCVARSWWDETPKNLQERCLLHLLRLSFPLAREMISVDDILQHHCELKLSPDIFSHPIIEFLCNKACSMSRVMPEWELVFRKQTYYAPLIKALIIRFVQYHHGHLERLYCTRSMCQLMADLIGMPIHLYWATPKTRNACADCIINPSGDASYYSNDNSILLCCEKDFETNQSIFVLLKREQSSSEKETTLRFALNTEEECSFEVEDMESPYALWYYQKGTHETDLCCNFVLENDSVYSAPCSPSQERLYFIYPTDPARTILLPFPHNCRLYVFAKLANGIVQYISEMLSYDIYVYFALPEETQSVLCLTDTDKDAAMKRL